MVIILRQKRQQCGLSKFDDCGLIHHFITIWLCSWIMMPRLMNHIILQCSIYIMRHYYCILHILNQVLHAWWIIYYFAGTHALSILLTNPCIICWFGKLMHHTVHPRIDLFVGLMWSMQQIDKVVAREEVCLLCYLGILIMHPIMVLLVGPYRYLLCCRCKPVCSTDYRNFACFIKPLFYDKYYVTISQELDHVPLLLDCIMVSPRITRCSFAFGYKRFIYDDLLCLLGCQIDDYASRCQIFLKPFLGRWCILLRCQKRCYNIRCYLKCHAFYWIIHCSFLTFQVMVPS